MRFALVARPTSELTLEAVHAAARAHLASPEVVKSDLRGRLGATACEVRPTFRFTTAGTVDRTAVTALELVFEVPGAGEAAGVATLAGALSRELGLVLRLDPARPELTVDEVRVAVEEGFADESQATFWSLAAALVGAAVSFVGVVLFGVLYAYQVLGVRGSALAIPVIALGIFLMAKPLVRGRY